MSQTLAYQSADPFGSRRRDQGSRWSRFIRHGALMFGWIVGAVLGMAGFGMAASGGVVPLAAVIGPVGFIVFIACLSQLLRALRQRTGAAVLSYVEQAVRLNLPLVRVLRAAQQSETGRTSRRLGAVCEFLEAGAPLEVALGAQVPELPDRVVRLTGASERLGRLPAMLRGLVTEQRSQRSGDFSKGGAFGLTYMLLVLLAIGCVIALHLVFVMPKFEQILRDFRVPPPPAMRWLRDAGYVGAAIMLPVIGFLALLCPAGWLSEVLLPGDPPRTRRRLLDWLIWWAPLAKGVVRDRGLADVCRVVGQGLRSGFPLDRAMAEAADLSINPGFRIQVRDWLEAIRLGLSVAEGAKRAHMPKLLVGMLSTAQATGGMADVFEFLSQYYQTRFSRAVLLVQSAALPVMSVVLGAIVCLEALSIFQPMIRMIDMVGMQWDKY